MPWGAAIAAVGAVAGSALASKGAKDAAQTQADAAAAASASAAAQRKPWLDAGKGALDTLQAGLAPGGQFTKKFSMADALNSPAEQEALRAGGESIQNSAAARGGLLGTNTLQDLTKFGQATGASYENQAFNQFQAEQARQLNPIQSLAQVGQTQANLTADTNANSLLAAGGAQAAGQAGAANAYGGAISNLTNILGQSKAVQGLFGAAPADASGQGTSASGVGSDASNLGSGYSNTDYSLSDERLKEDVVQVGKTNEGMPIYKYRMKGSRKMQMGVMAQDMEKKKPEAVAHDRVGFKMVDYSRVT